MSPEKFLENFGHVANAPGGIGKLRELILSFAFQGALTERIEGEQVDELLSALEAERETRASSKRGRKGKTTKDSSVNLDLTYPNGWGVISLGEVGSIFNGNSINKREKETKYRIKEGLPFIATKDVGYGRETLGYENGIRIPEDEPKFKVAHQGAVLICAEGGSAGRKCGITEQDVCFGNKLFAIEPYVQEIPSRFILYWFQAPAFQQRFQEAMTGIIGGISRNKFIALPFPLPPLAEQKRIVAKVNALMALCDRLETQQQDRTALRPKLAATSHTRFTENPTLENLRACFVAPGQANPKELRKTILSLAVQGKLMEQDEENKPAIDLIDLSSRRYRKVDPSGRRFPVPKGWNWVHFIDLGEQRLGKMLDKSKNRGALKPYLRNTNVQWNKFELDDLKEMKIEPDEEEQLRLKKGDLLICEGGEPGRCAIWNDDIEMYFQKALHRVRTRNGILPKYVAINLQNDAWNGVLSTFFTGATIKHFTGKSLARYPIPLAPASEQRRIVAKVDELMALVDKLEQLQTRREELAAAFAQSAVSALTGTEFKPKPEKMKAPKTELISKIRLSINPEDKEAAPLASLLADNNSELEAKTLWQRSGLGIEDFYQQLKHEITRGYIQQPEEAKLQITQEVTETIKMQDSATGTVTLKRRRKLKLD